MKLINYRVVLNAWFLFALQITLARADWLPVGGSLNVDVNRGATCTSQAIAISDAGVPYVTWHESNGTRTQVYVKHWNGSAWVQDGSSLNNNVGQDAKGACIRVAGETPYVTWCENSNIYVKRLIAGNWNSVGSNLNRSSDQVANPSITMAGNTPFVAWREKEMINPQYQIFIRRYNGASWVPSVGDNCGYFYADYPSVSIINGTPYVTYHDGLNPGFQERVTVEHYNGSKWNQTGDILNNDLAQSGLFPFISGYSNTPYVTWQEISGTAQQIFVKYFIGSDWVQLGGSLNVNTNNHGHKPCMAFYNNTPYVSWTEQEGANTFNLYVKHWNGLAWQQDGERLNRGYGSNSLTAFSSMAISGDFAYGAWVESDGNAMQIYVSKLDLNPAAVSIPLSIVDPPYSLSNRTASGSLAGVGFVGAPIIKLIRDGYQDVLASDIVVKSNWLLSCVLNLAGVTPGLYDVMIDIGGTYGYLRKSFQVLEPNTLPLQWRISDVGQVGSPVVSGNKSGMAVGDADGNGLQEIYAINRNDKFYKYSWQGASWAGEALPMVPTGEVNNDLVVCDGDNSGTREIYIAAQDGHVYQYSGANGTKVNVGSGGGQMNALAWGDGDNDGEIEIYAACEDGYIYQFQYNAGWVGNTIAASSVQMRSVAVGDADNDNEFEVYGSDINHKVYEISFNGIAWVRTEVGSGAGNMSGLVVADIDSDGNKELYGANEDYKVYRFDKVISIWQKKEIGAGNGVMFDLSASDGDNNGTGELYCACGDGHIFQFEYTNNQWVTNDIGSAQTPLYALVIGDGMNDNQYEIYAIGENSHVYQFKAISYMPTPTPIPNFGGKIISKDYVYCAPNPARGNFANVVIHTQQSAEINVKMFTTTNREVLSFGLSCPSQGKYTKQIYVGNIANGVYFLLVKAITRDGIEEKVKVKMALIK